MWTHWPDARPLLSSEKGVWRGQSLRKNRCRPRKGVEELGAARVGRCWGKAGLGGVWGCWWEWGVWAASLQGTGSGRRERYGFGWGRGGGEEEVVHLAELSRSQDQSEASGRTEPKVKLRYAGRSRWEDKRRTSLAA